MLTEVFLLSHETRLWSSTIWLSICPERRALPRLRLAPVLLYPAAPQAKYCARVLRTASFPPNWRGALGRFTMHGTKTSKREVLYATRAL
jgi:hypothetical protein